MRPVACANASPPSTNKTHAAKTNTRFDIDSSSSAVRRMPSDISDLAAEFLAHRTPAASRSTKIVNSLTRRGPASDVIRDPLVLTLTS
jgi:hypothetical protein